SSFMKKSYYLFNPGRLSRKDNTLKFIATDEDGNEKPPKYLPVEGIEELYAFGALDANSALYNYLGQKQVPVHFFDYYENYTGSYMPREYLLAGKVQVSQTLLYHNKRKRLYLAKCFVEASGFNMLKNLKYYQNRGRKLEDTIAEIESWKEKSEHANDIEELMGIEGNMRQCYYQGFEEIIPALPFETRSKQPPSNELNALISFGNMMCYTQCLKTIHHTQLNPTISFLHEPGTRRFSLALDLAEIFKPLLVDRTIFKVLNKKEIGEKDFDKKVNKVVMKEKGKKSFIAAFESRLGETIKHRTLKRKVSYKHLIKLECYKLNKHILGIQEYKPFKAWW
ncbi:MAG: type I-B CRISPR-associated endonuclease Cas1b, partial [Flavobacteriales bacterium]